MYINISLFLITKCKDLNSSNESTSTVSSLDFGTSLKATFDVNSVDILPLWNKYKLVSNDFVVCGSATIESDVHRLLQVFILLFLIFFSLT